MTKVYFSKKRTAGNPHSPKVGIKVENGVVTEAWYFIPGGEYHGEGPSWFVGREANEKFLEDFVISTPNPNWE